MSKTGTVKFFNVSKGFGFIGDNDGGEDLFVHANDVKGGVLQEGDEVQFDSEFDDAKGKYRASNVTGGTGSDRKGKGKKGKGKGKGGGKDGDWDCPGCGFLVFASKNECMKCGGQKPDEN